MGPLHFNALDLALIEVGINGLFPRSTLGGDIKEVLCGTWLGAAELMHQGLVGSARDEGPNNIGELIALLRESPNVVLKGFPGLLDVFFISQEKPGCVYVLKKFPTNFPFSSDKLQMQLGRRYLIQAYAKSTKKICR